VGKHSGNLERAHHTHTGDGCGFHRGNIFAVEENFSTGRPKKLGQQIKDSGLACAIRAYQGVDMAAVDFQVYIVNRHKALELFYQTLGFQNKLVTHVTVQPLVIILCENYITSLINVNVNVNYRKEPVYIALIDFGMTLKWAAKAL
jgi:hypothetical protein